MALGAIQAGSKVSEIYLVALTVDEVFTIKFYLFTFDCAGSSLCVDSSVVVAGGDCSLVVVLRPLISAAFLVAEHGF